ncbi:DNA-directed RNA polymerase subunit beta [Bacillus sp. FJAT-49711]|uniref:DNA-directed RNA polymerase subunit beta n=1 Tax=Bacillus sp. FJAT-49711 TaxID=2833585 RepID=UPI001BC92A2F|nr:DNA-directed RNA polymerase subunit beta [Bacillus sp. FJAT-49711]MBS4218926.1 DNA-directed RNA polymerase subunit beta [Bacillus sp. FJAT-49711]
MAKNISQDEVQSREDIKKQKRDQKAERKAAKKNEIPRLIRIRLIPIWLRILLVIAMVGGSLIGGLMVGYGVLGDGNPKDVLKKETWTHIVDLVVEKK